MAPDWPRLPPAYAQPGAPRSRTPPAGPAATLSLDLRDCPAAAYKETFRAALALTLAAHAGEPTYAFGVGERVVEGELRDAETVAALLDDVRLDKPRRGDVRSVLEFATPASSPPSAALHLVVDLSSPSSAVATLSVDPEVLTELEAAWFLSHLAAAFVRISSCTAETAIAAISLVSATERTTIASLSRSPAPPAAYPPSCTTLATFFLHSAKLTPLTTALQFDDTALTYAQLERLGRRFAAHLVADARVQPGTIVPVCVTKSIEMIVAMLGIILAGCGYLNLEPSFPAARKEGILRELRGTDLWSGVAVLMTGSGEEAIWSSWKDGQAQLVRTVDVSAVVRPLLASFDSPEADKDATPLPTPAPEDPAYLIYTSGSTGAPKGIVVEHRNVAAFLRNYRGVFGRAPGERVLQFPSYSFDVSVMNIWDTFAHGSTLCMTSQSALLSDLADAILRLDCTLVDLTPTIGALLFEHPEAQPRDGETVRDAWQRAGFRIKVVNTGGEKVERWVRDAWLERGVRVVIDYGPSETTVGVISNQRTTADSLVVPIGRPTGDNIIHILSSSLEIVPLGCIGEICVAGEQVTRGYVKKELNAAVFVEHPELGRIYRTGDLGRFLADGEGNIECLGRRDGQVKVNGLRIEVGEIEQHLTSALHSSIQRGVVDRLESDDLAPGLVAFLTLSSSASKTAAASSDAQSCDELCILPVASTQEFRSLVDDVKVRLAATLPPYMVPRYWLPVNRIPTQGMGKADRKALKRLAEAHDFSRGAVASSSLPRQVDEWHDAVRLAWAKVLRVRPDVLEDSDSFTRMGGDSIGFMKVVSVLREAGHRVPFAALADASTLSACAEVLKTNSASSTPPPFKYTEPFSLVPSPSHAAIFAELALEYSLSRADVVDLYPTAPSQDAILSASMDSTHYYAQAVYALDNSLPVETVTTALETLVVRHPALRTCFVVLEEVNSTIQVILSSDCSQVRDCLKVHVVRCDAGVVQQQVDNWLDRDRSRHEFRWGQLALSFAIIICSDDSRKLVWSMHHAMSDGWTLELLTTDLRAICHGLPVLERPPFATVVGWSIATRKPPAETREFWKNYLKGSQPLGWPLRTSPDEPFATSTVAQLHWSGDLAALVKRYGITPAIASRIAFAVALSHHTGSKDLSLGIVRSGRDIDLDGADAIVGPCVSVLPSRLQLERSPSLLDLATAEAASDRRTRAHQKISLSQLFKLCGFASRSALFDVLVTYQSFAERDDDEERKASWPIKQPPAQIRMPTNYALSFEITPFKDDPDALELACFFDGKVTSVVEVNTVLHMAAKVLDAFTAAPCTSVADLKLDSSPRTPRPAARDATGPPGLKAPEATVLQPLIEKLLPIWAEVLRTKISELESSDSWASVGGDSIAMMRLSAKLKKAGTPIPVQRLTTLPTLLSQAVWLARQDSE